MMQNTAIRHFEQYADRAWGLIQTKPSFEKSVQAYLNDYEIPTYLPVIYSVGARNRVGKRPMFRRYLFAAWGRADHEAVARCSGIRNERSIPLNCDAGILNDMEKLYRLEELSKETQITLDEVVLDRNAELIKITSGPFSGFDGIRRKLNGTDIITAILHVIGKTYEASIKA